jgi:hypothetical protein
MKRSERTSKILRISVAFGALGLGFKKKKVKTMKRALLRMGNT